jgi:hypothetical protein
MCFIYHIKKRIGQLRHKEIPVELKTAYLNWRYGKHPGIPSYKEFFEWYNKLFPFTVL